MTNDEALLIMDERRTERVFWEEWESCPVMDEKGRIDILDQMILYFINQ